ncbi:hypothetical protein ETD86_04585 [Nonomuraea turkmeniaca]|uniref:Uncharacterized protein n=1 Tax=Nonomuraea turkmeniaca TaxID=103838 RepID=A0A5S4FUV8_9ACTN|nr:hypothetical protein [Nonomuraea turkmeniaca]TMR24413.1 hypothetical protein ETD86_04585 [Nonomuraea turkmeniaca]
MLDVQLGELGSGSPAGVDEALELVAGFDDALVHGFARIGEEPAAALSALAGALAASPLGDRIGESVEKVVAGSIGDEHLAALAGGRAALTGAVHDALLGSLDAALGRTRAAWEAAPGTGDHPDNLLAGCRVWLRELAIVGWRGVDHDVVSSSDQAIEALLAVPELRGLAVLLDGLAAELRASCPVSTMEHVPARRWADLWSRALLLSQSGPWNGGAEQVSGRLLILGADVHEHATVVRVQVHGVFEPAGGAPARLVRTSVAAAKVDTIVGPAVWRLMGGHPVLLGALAEHRTLEITDMPLLGGGDLVWHDDRARAGEEADPFATARVQLGAAVAAPVPPLDRHPVRIAEPVFIEGYTVDGETLELGGGNMLALDLDRLPSSTPLTPELVAASTACLGLLHWDGGRWTLQPIAVQATVKKKPVAVHTGDWAMGPTDPKVVKAEAKAGDAVAVLRERAGRLLRK